MYYPFHIITTSEPERLLFKKENPLGDLFGFLFHFDTPGSTFKTLCKNKTYKIQITPPRE